MVVKEGEKTFFGLIKRMSEEKFEIITIDMDKDSKLYQAMIATRDS